MLLNRLSKNYITFAKVHKYKLFKTQNHYGRTSILQRLKCISY